MTWFIRFRFLYFRVLQVRVGLPPARCPVSMECLPLVPEPLFTSYAKKKYKYTRILYNYMSTWLNGIIHNHAKIVTFQYLFPDTCMWYCKTLLAVLLSDFLCFHIYHWGWKPPFINTLNRDMIGAPSLVYFSVSVTCKFWLRTQIQSNISLIFWHPTTVYYFIINKK